MENDVYTANWIEARLRATENGLQVIEHGWEQHVVIDEKAGVVYRYPRHEAAAAKLADEVPVLEEIHKHEWRVSLPVLIEHNEDFSIYKYIPGRVVTASVVSQLTDHEAAGIGTALGDFLEQLHELDPGIIDLKKPSKPLLLWSITRKELKTLPRPNFTPKPLKH